jgi:hypothetical protein
MGLYRLDAIRNNTIFLYHIFGSIIPIMNKGKTTLAGLLAIVVAVGFVASSSFILSTKAAPKSEVGCKTFSTGNPQHRFASNPHCFFISPPDRSCTSPQKLKGEFCRLE